MSRSDRMAKYNQLLRIESENKNILILDNFKTYFKKITQISILQLLPPLYFILISSGSFFELKRKKEFLQYQSISNSAIEKSNNQLSN